MSDTGGLRPPIPSEPPFHASQADGLLSAESRQLQAGCIELANGFVGGTHPDEGRDPVRPQWRSPAERHGQLAAQLAGKEHPARLEALPEEAPLERAGPEPPAKLVVIRRAHREGPARRSAGSKTQVDRVAVDRRVEPERLQKPRARQPA